ncbi:unnamed protein product, partial [Strongylus vulgaris]
MTTGARKKKSKHLPAIHQPILKATPLRRTDDSDSGKANSISSRLTDTPKLDEDHEFKFNEELERTLKAAEGLLIEEDDESSETSTKNSPPTDSGRPNSSTSRTAEPDEIGPSTSAADNMEDRKSVISEAERKAEMIRKEKLADSDEEDFIRDEDSDPIAGIYSDNEDILASDEEQVVGNRVGKVVHSSDSQKEEILPPDDDEEDPTETTAERMVHSSHSQKEEILPADEEDTRPKTSHSTPSQLSRREAEEPQQRPTTSADSNREEILP